MSATLDDTKAATTTATNMVVLVGIFRSGTSLLHTILNQHSQIALMFEANVWDFPNFASSLRMKHDWLKRQEFYTGVLSRHNLITVNEIDNSGSLKTLTTYFVSSEQERAHA